MDAPLVVIIAKSDHTTALRKRIGTDHAIAVFADAESLRAIEAILLHDEQPTFLPLRRGKHRIGIAESERHWLLDHHVFTALGTRHHMLAVELVRSGWFIGLTP